MWETKGIRGRLRDSAQRRPQYGRAVTGSGLGVSTLGRNAIQEEYVTRGVSRDTRRR